MVDIQNLVLDCLKEIDFPIDRMPKATWASRVPIVLLSLGGIGESDNIKNIKSFKDKEMIYRSRDIIELLNQKWSQNISRGSYDEVRRSCVKYLVEAGLVLKNPDDPERATNSPASGYALSEDFKKIILAFNTKKWDIEKENFLIKYGSLRNKLANPRNMKKIKISINKKIFDFTPGKHNELQKIILEEFLPRFTKQSIVIYVGDSTNRQLYYDKDLAEEIGLFELSHEQLPDVIAFDKLNKWLFFVEAVVSSGHISELRKLELDRMLKKCKYDVVMVSAFMNRQTMKEFLGDIAWETEVWLAEDPSHLIHFNGDKFLGPY